VHLDQLPDLQEEARRMMSEAINTIGQGPQHRICPFGMTGDYPASGAADATMDFQFQDQDMSASASVDTVPDPVVNVARRTKRARSQEEDDEGCEGVSGEMNIQLMDPDEPSPSPRSARQNAATFRSKKHFHGENVQE